MPPRAEQVQRLPVHKEYCFLGFMDDQLGAGIKVLNRRLPYKSGVIAFVFYNLEYICHWLTSMNIIHNIENFAKRQKVASQDQRIKFILTFSVIDALSGTRKNGSLSVNN
jgi:hypothetical protein